MAALEYLSLLDCLNRGTPIGTLATAVEVHGVYAWDRYGRFRLFKETADPERQAVLDRLATEYKRDNSPYDDDGSLDDPEDLLVLCGWPNGQGPNFDQIGSVIPTVKSRAELHGAQRTEKTNLAIIGGLLAFIRGDFSKNAHPDFATQEQLVALLCEKLEGIHGSYQRCPHGLHQLISQLAFDNNGVRLRRSS